MTQIYCSEDNVFIRTEKKMISRDYWKNCEKTSLKFKCLKKKKQCTEILKCIAKIEQIKNKITKHIKGKHEKRQENVFMQN